jgi:hypothetical protein
VSFARRFPLCRRFAATAALLNQNAFVICNRQEIWTTLARVRPLEQLRVDARGWTLDVLNVVRALDKKEFVLQDVYAFAAQLQKLHPGNRHVPDKIRQQLQVLRILGFVEFLGHGCYRSL